MTTLESTDIRFECSKCGQHLVVDAAGVGLTADCPICETSVTVPKQSSRDAGSASEVAGGLTVNSPKTVEPAPDKALAHPERAAYIDPDIETLREELIDASLLNGRLERQIDTSASDVARLQQQLKAATDECERLTASATHAQAELKTFQNERQQLKADLASARQRLTAAETQQAERDTELGVVKGQLEASQGRCNATQEQLTAKESALGEAAGRFDQLTQEHTGLQGQLAAREETLGQRDNELADLRTTTETKIRELEETLATVRQDLEQAATESTELRRQLDEALPQVEEGRKNRTQLTQTEDELLSTLEKLQTTENTVKTLQQDLENQTKEAETLRKDLVANDAGRELLEVRERLTQTEAEREHWVARSGILEKDLQTVRGDHETLQAQADSFRKQHEEAVQKLAAVAQSKVMQDNDVLRGIVSRQNSELAQQHGELYRHKRARYALKIVYALFGLGLIGVVAFACKILAHVKL